MRADVRPSGWHAAWAKVYMLVAFCVDVAPPRLCVVLSLCHPPVCPAPQPFATLAQQQTRCAATAVLATAPLDPSCAAPPVSVWPWGLGRAWLGLLHRFAARAGSTAMLWPPGRSRPAAYLSLLCVVVGPSAGCEPPCLVLLW